MLDTQTLREGGPKYLNFARSHRVAAAQMVY